MSRKHGLSPEIHRQPAVHAHPGPRLETAELAPRPPDQCAVCGGMAFARCAPCRARNELVQLCDMDCADTHARAAHPRFARDS
jgi:hypothetical protein